MSKAKVNIDIYIDEEVANDLRELVNEYPENYFGPYFLSGWTTDRKIAIHINNCKQLNAFGVCNIEKPKIRINSIKIKDKWLTIYKRGEE